MNLNMVNCKSIAIVFMIAIIVLTSNAYATGSFSNYRTIDRVNSNYGVISIWDGNIISADEKVADYELLDNTDLCINSCYAEGTVTLYKEGKIFDGVEFKTLSGSLRNIPNKLYLVDSIEKEIKVDDYKEVCEESIALNGTRTTNCRNEVVGSHNEIIIENKKNLYDGDVLAAGTYKWRIEGTKNRYETIDWIALDGITNQRMTEWATWSPSLNTGLVAGWTLNSNTSEAGVGSIWQDIFSNVNLTGENKTIVSPGIINNGANVTESFGITDYRLYVADQAPINFNGNLSISYWVKWDTWANDQCTIYKRAGLAGGEDGYGLCHNTVSQVQYHIAANNYNINFPAGNAFESGKWYHIALVWNNETKNATIWVNGTMTAGAIATSGYVNANVPLYIGSANAATGNYNANKTMDEIYIWNRTLTNSEISDLYNNGEGISYLSGITASSNSPANNYYTTGYVEFNCSASSALPLTNISLVDNSTGSWKINKTIVVTGATNSTIFNNTYQTGNYLWNCYACNDASNCAYNTQNRTLIVRPFVETNQTYNATTYETSAESYLINITYDSTTYSTPTASLIYAGAPYSGTLIGSGNNITFLASLDAPTVTTGTNVSFYWNISIGGTAYQTIAKNQTVNPIILARCNDTYTVAYVNFTFKDETTDAYMSAVTDLSTWNYHLGSGSVYKTFLYSNLTQSASYAYCFSPADKTVSANLVYQYSNTSYPQRYYSIDTTYTNATTNKILYLLNSASGIYVSFVAQNPLGNAPISGVNMVVERQFSGIWTQVGQALTDNSGTATFWLNPNYDHRVTATKSGYTTQTLTVRPTQSVYTIIMGSSVSVTNYTWEGITWNVGPKDFVLSPNTPYTFFFNVTANLSNLVKCKMELRNTSEFIMTYFEGSATAGGTKCIATGSYTDLNNSYQLNSYLYLDLGKGYGLLKAKDPWLFENYTANTNMNFFDLLSGFNDMSEWGATHNRQEFSKIVAFFFIIIILIGGITYFTGYDFAQPGSALILLWGLITLGSFAGIFTIQGLSIPQFQFFDKYTVWFITSFLTWGFLINHWRRANG